MKKRSMTSTVLEFVVAKPLPKRPPEYYIKRKRWTVDPHRAAHFTLNAARTTIERFHRHCPNVTLEIVHIHDAVRLFALDRRLFTVERRGDTRSLLGPDDAGVRTLTAR